MKWDIRRKGHTFRTIENLFELLPEKIEIFDGKPFWSDEERLNMLALLLENVGIDEAIKLADLELWQKAINDEKKLKD